MTTFKALSYVVLSVSLGVIVSAQQPARGGGRGGPPPDPLTKPAYVGHDKINACAAGGTFINTPEYVVQCAHRNGQPGPFAVEIHTKETDVLYIVDGEATFVTGGTVAGLDSSNPLQLRGKSIEGGETHRLTKGDVMVIPAGTPHWFKEVPQGISYFVVKPLKP
jgi:mannose-6-phosphate isomerase-like protein (cupin superfamily)